MSDHALDICLGGPMFRLAILTGLAAFGLSCASAFGASAPLGYWAQVDDKTGQTRSLMEIYQAGPAIEGKIAKLINPPEDAPVCSACPEDDPRHGQPIEGLVIMTEMAADTSGDSWSGKIMDPENGRTYRTKVWLDEEGNLKVRGYVGVFYRTQTWLPAESGADKN